MEKGFRPVRRLDEIMGHERCKISGDLSSPFSNYKSQLALATFARDLDDEFPKLGGLFHVLE